MSHRVLLRTRIGRHRRLLLWTIALHAFLIPAFAQISQTYPSRVVTIAGDCEADLRPAKAVVSGGIAVSALKPSSAADQLDKQMELIREYVRQNQGELTELERVRMIHTEGSVNGQPRDPSFQLAQRIRAEFSADAPIDSILEHLMELGLDRFGDNMSPAESRQSIVVVRYESTTLTNNSKKFATAAPPRRWKQWCVSAGAKSLSCKAGDLPESLQLQSLTLALHRKSDARRRADRLLPGQHRRLSIGPTSLAARTTGELAATSGGQHHLEQFRAGDKVNRLILSVIVLLLTSTASWADDEPSLRDSCAPRRLELLKR